MRVSIFDAVLKSVPLIIIRCQRNAYFVVFTPRGWSMRGSEERAGD